MCPNTCENEQAILKALRNEEELEGRIPSFVQSIMGHLQGDFFAENDTDDDPISDDLIVFTDAGDYTLFKAFGYDSHWCGCPPAGYAADDALKEKAAEMTAEIKKKHPNYTINTRGKIQTTNNITGWYVGPAIKDAETLKFFIEHTTVKPPDPKVVEKWKNSRSQCFEKNWCQFISTNMVMEGGLGASLGLISKLARKNPDLLEEWYDHLMEGPIMSFKAAADAGFKLFCTADDMAYKTGPMMSPKNYQKFVTPRAKKLCDIVRDVDGVIFMHTDGYIYDILDLFIEAGYHAIQPLEPTSGMTIKKVKEGWGDKLACIGNVDTTRVLPFGTEEEVRANVRRCMKEGGKKGYMFAASGTLHKRVTYKNARAMIDEYNKINDGIVKI
jgi:hypothetical protein